MWISTAAKRDWPYFARWHYRSHHVGLPHHVTLLWHRDEPIGICLFTSPPLALRMRHRYFGLSGRWSRTAIRARNGQLVMLSRVVLHPTYRGAGIAAAFVRASCRSCPFPWIEALAQMGRVNPFLEKAGFRCVGESPSSSTSRAAHSARYGGNRKNGEKGFVTEQTFVKSRYARPLYYIFDNRDGRRPDADAG